MSHIKEYKVKEGSCHDLAIQINEPKNLNLPMIKTYITAIRHNLRQWSACTLRRGEVNRTGKKSKKQKGTGGARHGDRAAPQMRKGGRAHGPKPKFDQHVRINQKERQAATRSLLGEKIKENQVFFVSFEFLNQFKEAPKTKLAYTLLKKLGLDSQKTLVAFGDVSHDQFEEADNFKLSLRNVPLVHMTNLAALSGYDLVRNKNILIVAASKADLETYINA